MIHPDDLFTIRQTALLLGLPYERVRGWADRGVLDCAQPQRGMERLVPGAEILRLTRRGYRLHAHALAEHANHATPADAAAYADAAHPADAVSGTNENVA